MISADPSEWGKYKRTPMSLFVILQYGIKGTTTNNLRENYANISFVFSMRDFWYTHGRNLNIWLQLLPA
jgi:hypothetical protein